MAKLSLDRPIAGCMKELIVVRRKLPAKVSFGWIWK
jgi:hypothetical protein